MLYTVIDVVIGDAQGIEEEEVKVPDPVDTSFVNTIANSYQSAIIQKENTNLRETCRKLQVSLLMSTAYRFDL
jgi:hypothetical protein